VAEALKLDSFGEVIS